MSGFEVVTNDVRDAARRMRDAAAGVVAADPSADVQGIGSAMPGSRSAATADRLSRVWAERFRSWSDDATEQQAKMEQGAADYDAADHQAALRERMLQRRLGVH